MSKQCSKCGEMKEDFPHKKSYCRQCGNEMTRDYKRRNKEKIAEYNKKYKEEHKDEVSVYNHNYNLDNRKTIQERQTKTAKERRKTDENYNLIRKYCGRLKKNIKAVFNMKDDKCEELYSCKPSLIIGWFEYLFDKGMNWENHGSLWHIDHIKPCCSYNLINEDELKACFHWSNLRPLLALENQKKTNKIDEELIKEYKTITEIFLELYENL
jgi:hypothetical protein